MRNIQQSTIDAMRIAAEKGIGKRLQADLGGAKVRYRGIEDAMNEMVSVLVTAGITVTPRYSDLQITERDRGNGKASQFATVKGSFEFEAEDRSTKVAEFYGQAMDFGDKAVVKAQSISFRTALFQTFCVPTVATAIDPEAGVDGDPVEYDAAALATAKRGTAAYATFWEKLTKERRNQIGLAQHGELKEIAAKADREVGGAA